MTQSGDARRAEIDAGLQRTRARIADACASAGRSHDEVTLIVVTKFFPASDVHLLHELGVRDVGENRHPEARDKKDACAGLDLRWHYIGGLQSNKAAAVAKYADAVHSVDRPKLVDALAGAERALDVLVQVDLDPDAASGRPANPGRAGARPAEVAGLAEAILARSALRLRGVMAVAPLEAHPAPAFERLAEVAELVRGIAPDATWISAGMSGDLEPAIHAGATHVRVGSAVLGSRPVRR